MEHSEVIPSLPVKFILLPTVIVRALAGLCSSVQGQLGTWSGAKNIARDVCDELQKAATQT